MFTNSYNHDEQVTLNARGVKYQIPLSSLDTIPESRLAKLKSFIELKRMNPELAKLAHIRDLCDYYDANLNEFYFNKDPYLLSVVLGFYEKRPRDVKIHLTLANVCVSALEHELETYWRIDDFKSYLEPCCKINLDHRQERTAEFIQQHKLILEKYYFKEEFTKKCHPTLKEKIWDVMENPSSSFLAKIYITFSYSMIIISVIDIVLRTIPEMRHHFYDESSSIYETMNPFYIVEFVVIIWFTLELLVKFVVCPNMTNLLFSPFTICDLLSIVPFYVYLTYVDSEIIELLKDISRIFRICSLLKVFRKSDALSTILYTMRHSIKEIMVFVAYLMVGMLIFSTLIYYTERQTPNTTFTTIPAAFW
jgi:potassium voltage-gated channel Shab-related subfamily B protein 1